MDRGRTSIHKRRKSCEADKRLVQMFLPSFRVTFIRLSCPVAMSGRRGGRGRNSKVCFEDEVVICRV